MWKFLQCVCSKNFKHNILLIKRYVCIKWIVNINVWLSITKWNNHIGVKITTLISYALKIKSNIIKLCNLQMLVHQV
jgi:hypothetical protein